MLNTFHCVPLKARAQSVVGCVARHERARKEARGDARRGESHLIGGIVCAGCTVGAAHAAGSEPALWFDGSPVERRTLTLAVSRSESRPEEGGSPPNLLSSSGRDSGCDPGRDPDASSPAEESRLPRRRRESQEDRRVAGNHRPPKRAMPARQPQREGVTAGETALQPSEDSKKMAKLHTWKGRSLTLGQWASEPDVEPLGLNASALRMRLANGWTLEEALTTPKADPGVHVERESRGKAPKTKSQAVMKAFPRAPDVSRATPAPIVVRNGARAGKVAAMVVELRELAEAHEADASALRKAIAVLEARGA